jgi:hypothetical protein
LNFTKIFNILIILSKKLSAEVEGCESSVFLKNKLYFYQIQLFQAVFPVHVPASKSAKIFNLVSKVVITLGFLAFLVYCADMTTGFIVTINK